MVKSNPAHAPHVGGHTCRLLGTVALSLALIGMAGANPAMAGDDCTTATAATVGDNLANNTGADADLAEASCQADSNHDWWFYWTATCDGEVRAHTYGSAFAPTDDTVLSVWDACGGTEIACDDDSGTGLHGALKFLAAAGSTYYMRVAGFEDAVGDILLHIEPADDCLIDSICYFAGDLSPTNACMGCVPELSTTAWSIMPKGTVCGDPAMDDCDNPDACNDSGVCESNHKPDGTACTDDGNECSEDYCVSGACTHAAKPVGTTCGDPADTECDNPNTCDAEAVCQENYEAVDTPCGSADDTDCDNPDSCDGAGMCLLNHEADGYACTDDGNDCTDDVCATGLCDHPNHEAGHPCGDQVTDTTCDHPDSCDGDGLCLVNYAENGTICDDDDACTTGPEACDTGLCVGTLTLEAPLVNARGCRTLEVTPQPAGDIASVALVVTSPDWPCLHKYVGADGMLTDTAFEQPIADWGTVFVIGQDIVPSTEYDVHAECDAYVTDVGSATTHAWGDTNGNTVVNLTDVICVLNAHTNNTYTGCETPDAEMGPCTPDRVINLIDVLDVLDAFVPIPYPCPDPCEPLVEGP